jgi:hypothetical protein
VVHHCAEGLPSEPAFTQHNNPSVSEQMPARPMTPTFQPVFLHHSIHLQSMALLAIDMACLGSCLAEGAEREQTQLIHM